MGAHMELLVEEPSMEAFLRALLPRLLPQDRTFDIHPFQGKDDLLGKLSERLRGYASWLPDEWSVIVVVDRDNDDCLRLKQHMEDVARQAGLITRTAAGHTRWQVANRIAIEELEELEAWYFGDWQVVRTVYPRVPPTIRQQRGYRDPDQIAGGTWEAFERVLQLHGYFKHGLRKIEAARVLDAQVDVGRNDSASFGYFHRALMEAIA